MSELPYGVSKRVDLARAIVQSPRLLLLDEPASGLSQRERGEMCNVLKQVRDRYELTIVLVEHDMGFVNEICERVVVLQSGRKIADGSCGDVLSRPEVINAFLGAEV
jgi:branched-chain amino acid transport system ATP-binding protein